MITVDNFMECVDINKEVQIEGIITIIISFGFINN